MYRYRELTPEEKTEILQQRQLNGFPPHTPPHLHKTEGWFLITAATYEHKRYFRTNEERAWLLDELQKELQVVNVSISGWVVLPNHYHLLVAVSTAFGDQSALTPCFMPVQARELNRREGLSGRQVWYRFSDRQIRNEKHYYTTLNYIHYNPTKHNYIQKPKNWICSSLHWYEKHFGIEWL